MQSSDRVLARRYALALYQSAAAAKEEQSAAEEIAKAARAFGENELVEPSPRFHRG